MRSWKSIGLMALASASVAVLTACGSAQIPVATNFDYAAQRKVRSAGHWDLMARDVVARTLGSLDASGVAHNTGIYVALPDSASDFDRGFREFLITKLVESGVTVLDNEGDAHLQLSYSTQVVLHHSSRLSLVPAQHTKVLDDGLSVSYDQRFVHAEGAQPSQFENHLDAGGPTHTEVIVTTSLKRVSHYLVRKTDVYYLENVDAPLFLRGVMPVSNFTVVDR